MKLINIALAIAILSVGGAGAYYLWNAAPPAPETGGHGHGEEHAEEDFERGPHNGRLLRSEGFDLEITIFEDGMPPQFRVFAYDSGTKLDPMAIDLRIDLVRHGGRIDEIQFVPESDYLRGVQVVDEPHSFDVMVQATRGEESYSWRYASYEGRLELSDEAAEFAEIRSVAATSAVIKTTVELPGEITLNAENIAHVVPRLAGVVRRIEKRLGDSVQATDVLAVLDSRELADAKSEYLTAREHRTLAQASFEREDTLYKQKVTAGQDFLKAKEQLARSEIDVKGVRQKLISLGLTEKSVNAIAKESAEELTEYVIRTPISGVITEKHVTQGEAVESHADMFVIADLSTVWAKIVVYAKDLPRVHEGQRVTVKSSDLDKTAQGVISYIGPLMGEHTRTATAIVELANPDGAWRPGLYVSVELIEEEFEAPVAVPLEAIQTFRDWNVVFVKHGTTYEISPVELGRSDGTMVEILSGLAPGEVYVFENSYVVKADILKAGASHDH